MCEIYTYRLGLLSDELVDLAGSPLDALCSHLQKKLQYKPGERDAIYLHHFIGIEWPDKKVGLPLGVLLKWYRVDNMYMAR